MPTARSYRSETRLDVRAPEVRTDRIRRSLQPPEEQGVADGWRHGSDEEADDALEHEPAIAPMKITAIGTSLPRPSSSGFSTLALRPTAVLQIANTTATRSDWWRTPRR